MDAPRCCIYPGGGEGRACLDDAIVLMSPRRAGFGGGEAIKTTAKVECAKSNPSDGNSSTSAPEVRQRRRSDAQQCDAPCLVLDDDASGGPTGGRLRRADLAALEESARQPQSEVPYPRVAALE
ncbi:hypothetical protein AAL_02021 [Moelleriella libera RCEF 2490]|uniref:Uncharacterized protein n=1 Tax=Moelleriella libera RCEF 2490 TaxID=1081109 RepID=A0A168F427_9HYPO|nr:hypothetical protein AAL_02021 [Moelleriella libera RCEF 2490]